MFQFLFSIYILGVINKETRSLTLSHFSGKQQKVLHTQMGSFFTRLIKGKHGPRLFQYDDS